jgi:hypothetical protein
VFTQPQQAQPARPALFCSHVQKRPVVTPVPATLTDSAFCNSFPCRSYEITGSGTQHSIYFPYRCSLSTTHYSLTPVESADPKNSPITPLQSADPKTKHLKSFRIRRSEKKGGRGGQRLTRNPSGSAIRPPVNFQLLTACPEPRRVDFLSATSHQSPVTNHGLTVTGHPK